jgi:solute carrier family 36 (proton-coupled amino acid transporter)
MKEPEKFKNMFLTTAFIVCGIYVLFAVLSCLAFGNRIEHIILLNLQRERNYFLLFQILYALALVFSYPVQLYPIIQIIEKTRHFQNFILGPKNTFIRRLSFRFFLSVFVFLMAFLIPKFSAFINLIGAFCGIAIQFVFPILSYQIIFRKNIPWSIWILNFFVLFIAVTGAIFACIDSIKELASESEF